MSETTTTAPGEKKKPDRSTATRLVNLARARNAELFVGQDDEPYATVPVGASGSRDTLLLSSRGFRDWLADGYFAAKRRTPSGSATADAVGVLSGMARASGARHDVHLRVAAFGDATYVDLCDAERRVVAITAAGWSVGPAPDRARFVRKKGMGPLPTPVAGRPLRETLPTYLRIDPNSDTFKLYVAWLVAALRGVPPFTILDVDGQAGSTKSTACRLARRAFDPSYVNLGSLPRDERDLAIAARSSYVVGFDNLSWLNDGMADALCRLSTGSGFRTRQLTTDSDEVLFAAHRPVLINGISSVVHRSDMVDRALFVSFPGVEDAARLTEAEVDVLFDSVHAEVLGALCDAVAQSIRKPVRPQNLPRMADFACVVESAAPALGWEEGEFLGAYARNRAEAAEAALEDEPIAVALEAIRTVRNSVKWTGRMKDLLREITGACPDELTKQLPANVKGLERKLARLTTLLSRRGIRYTPPPRGKLGPTMRDLTIAFTPGQLVLPA